MRLLFLFNLASCVWCLLSAAESRPNIIVILTDDQGWGDLSLHGNTNLATPHLDALARDGARFEHFYVCPVCSPTRAEFLTGRYHPRGNVYSTSAGGERLDLDEVTIADHFKAAGHATGAFGKWHNGTQFPYHPNGRGFDEFYGFCSGHWAHYFSPLLDHNGEVVTGNGYLTDDFTDRALEFIRANRDRPFFCYLPYCTPHSPMQVPDPFWEKFREKDLASRHREPGREKIRHTRAALAMVESIDTNVGRLLAGIEELGLGDDTIVVFFCDNGPNGARWNGGMKGQKGSTDEGGVRSPLFIRWPGQIRPGTRIPQIAAAIDLLPTLLDLSGCEPAPEGHLDGRSLAPLLLGKADDWPERTLFSFWRNRLSIRNERFRLDPAGRLFDLRADPGQRTDVAAQHPGVTAELTRAGEAWRAGLLAGYGPEHDHRPFVVGHPAAEWTQLPARDARFSGGIRRSNRFPNASYLTHWTNPEDRITWDAHVPADGLFEATLHHTCPEEAVGATIELSFGDQSTTATVTTAHDPPLRGAAEDRVPRMESYDKDFRALPLGRITLKKGEGPLTLRAVEVPAGQVVDVRLLTLRRVE